MSERPKGGDPFDDIIAKLQLDDSFMAGIAGANERLAAASETKAPSHLDYLLPHVERPIDGVGVEIHSAFLRLCNEYHIDPNDYVVGSDPDTFERLCSDLRLEMYGVRSQLWEGDIVTARGAVIVDQQGDSKEMLDVIAIKQTERVIGRYRGPALGMVPDDVMVMTKGRLGDTPFGVGLLLDEPMFVNAQNEATRPFDGDHIVVALGTLGLRLGKYYFK